jgi:hypothetical protein
MHIKESLNQNGWMVDIHFFLYIYVCIYIYSYICIHTYMYIYIFRSIHIHKCIYVYIIYIQVLLNQNGWMMDIPPGVQ